MKQVFGGILLLTAAACSSSPDGSGTGGTGAGGMGGTSTTTGTGGTGGTIACGSATPTLLYTVNAILRGPAVDDQFVYFFEGASKINKIAKTGGTSSNVSTSTTGLLDVMTRVYVDGSKLYYSDNKALYSLDKTGGALTALAMSGSTNATGIHPGLAFDAEYVYFGDRVSSKAGDANGTVSKVSKSGGTPTVLATAQAGPSTLAVDDANVYFINEGTIDYNFVFKFNSSVASVAKAGGAVRSLFTEKGDGSGISPTAGDLLVAASKLYFSSINLDEVSSSGEFELAKTGGTPVSFNDCPTFGAFLENGTLYADCGDSITKFDLATGAESDLVCFPTELEGSVGMTHDASKIYYIKLEHATGGANPPYSIYSIPLE